MSQALQLLLIWLLIGLPVAMLWGRFVKVGRHHEDEDRHGDCQ